MQKSFSKLLTSALDLLLPPRKSETAVRELSPDDLLAMATLEGPLPYHDPRVTALVWELKYRGNARAAALAGGFLSDLLIAEAAECIGKPLLIPMPMHAARRRERGFNQTELLCETTLAALSGRNRLKKVLGGSQTVFSAISASDFFEYAPVLERIRNTPPQQGLARHKRLSNVKNSMQITNPARVAGRVCMVVDDVSTTGASFAEARRALRLAGAREVRCVALSVS